MRQPDRIVAGQRLSAGRHWNPSVNAITDLQARVARLERTDADPLNAFPGYGTLVTVQNIEEQNSLLPFMPWAIDAASFDDEEVLMQRPVLNVRGVTIADLGNYVIGASWLKPGEAGLAWIQGLCPVYMRTPSPFLACKRADKATGAAQWSAQYQQFLYSSWFEGRLDGCAQVLWEETVPDPVNTTHLALCYLEGMPANWVKIYAPEDAIYYGAFPTSGQDAIEDGAIEVSGADGIWPTMGGGYGPGAYLHALTQMNDLWSMGLGYGVAALPDYPVIVNAVDQKAGYYYASGMGISLPADYHLYYQGGGYYFCPIGSPLFMVLAHPTGTNLSILREIQNDGQLSPAENFVTIDLYDEEADTVKIVKDVTLDPLGKVAAISLMDAEDANCDFDGGVWV